MKDKKENSRCNLSKLKFFSLLYQFIAYNIIIMKN